MQIALINTRPLEVKYGIGGGIPAFTTENME